jgi:hypothetical protein
MTWDVDGRSWVVKSIWDENLGLVYNDYFIIALILWKNPNIIK